MLLYVHRNRRFIKDGSPGRPPRLSHSSWALYRGDDDDDDDDDDDVELNVLGCRVDILGTNCDQRLSMAQCCFTITETTVRLIRTGSPGRATSTFTQLLSWV